MRKIKVTRGRKSDGDRVYPATTGNFEVNSATLLELLNECELNLDQDAQEKLLAHINWRITQTRNQHLTWGEVKEPASDFVEHAVGLRNAIQEISQTGQSTFSRPHGWNLLDDLDFDFNHRRAGEKTHWQDVVEWLGYVSEQFEARFISPGGRAEPYREFIRECRDILRNAGALSRADHNHKVTVLLVALENKFPGLGFPQSTIPESRYEYVRNALRSEKR